jgi:hypothetical protein
VDVIASTSNMAQHRRSTPKRALREAVKIALGPGATSATTMAALKVVLHFTMAQAGGTAGHRG